MPFGAIDVSLHLAKRDRPIGKASIRVEYRIRRILPALIDQARGALPVVFDKPVLIEVAIGVDPAQRRQRIRPQGPDSFDIAGACVVFAHQHHIEGRCIDAAVIAAERNFAKPGHLAATHFVQDLAGLGIALAIDFDRLGRGEEAQHSPRNRRVEPQRH